MNRPTKSPLPIEGHPGDAQNDPGYVERREEAEDEKPSKAPAGKDKDDRKTK